MNLFTLTLSTLGILGTLSTCLSDRPQIIYATKQAI